MDNTKIKIELSKENIKQAASMMDMMISSGNLYEDHPIVELMNEIINECVKQKKKK